jgi:hypothetical protein
VPGFTDSADFPVTAGAFQGANAGGFDIFLVKVDPHGSTAIKATRRSAAKLARGPRRLGQLPRGGLIRRTQR